MNNSIELDDKIYFSVVSPVYNEEENIEQLYNRLTEVMSSLSKSYEIIFVDDGSKDSSFKILEKLHEKDKNVKVIRFSRNFGHHIAITAGLDYAQGSAVILMDSDLQDAPEEIPKLYEKFKEGYDIVYAIREIRSDPLVRKLASKFFYMVFKTFARVEIPANSGTFTIMSRRVVKSLENCREKSRFVTALMSWPGFAYAEVKVKRDARYAGKTKYTLFGLIRLGMQGITAFSYFPLQLATYIGFFAAFSGFSLGIFMVIKRIFFGFPIIGYASIIVSILFIGGIQLLILGIIGEYIGRIYTEAQNRPLYIIDEVLQK